MKITNGESNARCYELGRQTTVPEHVEGHFLPATEVRHLRGHHRHRRDVAVQRQARHVHNGARHILYAHPRLGPQAAIGLQDPLSHFSVMSVAALPISIWPHAMSYGRPSRAVDLVSPVMACLVAV